MSTRRVLRRLLGGTPEAPRVTVDVVPVLQDNFSYIVRDVATNNVAVVDVSDVAPIREALSALAEPPRSLSVWSTHKHEDHCGGNVEMTEAFPGITVYAGRTEPVPCAMHLLDDGSSFSLGDLVVTVLHTPCHTSGHVVFYVTHPDDPSAGALFTGDTLFCGGIGAFFEGTAATMVSSLRKITNVVSGSACVFPGHEYTVNFLKFTKSVLEKGGSPSDLQVVEQEIEKLTQLVGEGLPSVPTTLAEEMLHNVFLRVVVDDKFRREVVGAENEVDAMQMLYDACP